MFRYVSCERADCLWFGEYLPPRVVWRGPFLVRQSLPRRFVRAIVRHAGNRNSDYRRMRNVTRFWNWADHQDNCEEYFDILALMTPDCFADPVDTNSIRFTY